MYEFALEDTQRYKEAHVILEKALIQEKEGFLEDTYNVWRCYNTQFQELPFPNTFGMSKTVIRYVFIII